MNESSYNNMALLQLKVKTNNHFLAIPRTFQIKTLRGKSF